MQQETNNQNTEQTTNTNVASRLLFRILRRRIINERINADNPEDSNIFENNNTNNLDPNFSTASRQFFNYLSSSLIPNQNVSSPYLGIENNSSSSNTMNNILNNDLSNNNISLNNLVNDLPIEENKESTFLNIVDEYPDFRTYPLNIDWKEVEKGKTFAYEAMIEYGYLGAHVYSTINNHFDYQLGYKKLPYDLIELYSKIVKKNEISNIKKLISNLPTIEDLENLVLKFLINYKELILYKVILDCYLHYYTFLELNSLFQFKVLSLMEYFIDEYINLIKKSSTKPLISNDINDNNSENIFHVERNEINDKYKHLKKYFESKLITNLYNKLNLNTANLLKLSEIKKMKTMIYYKNIELISNCNRNINNKDYNRRDINDFNNKKGRSYSRNELF